MVVAITLWKKYCSRKCAYIGQRRKQGNGFYVYVWKDANTVFYVGKGQGYRYVTIHTSAAGNKAICQQKREESKTFGAEIICSNLTEKGAFLIEGALIAILKPECNIVSGQIPKELQYGTP